VSNIIIDTTQAATDTIDYVATDTWGNTATDTRTVIVQAAISSSSIQQSSAISSQPISRPASWGPQRNSN
jgi:hypothetical protein